MFIESKTIVQRFLKSFVVNKDTGCWEWQKNKNKKRYGYGKIGIGYFREFKGNQSVIKSAHRVAYEIYKGLIPKEMSVCHHCDNPSCVNPNHLWLGTAKDNAQDRVKKGRKGNIGLSLASRNGLVFGHLSKLSELQVLEIREILKNTTKTYKEISKGYGVSRQTIGFIKNRKIWKNI